MTLEIHVLTSGLGTDTKIRKSILIYIMRHLLKYDFLVFTIGKIAIKNPKQFDLILLFERKAAKIYKNVMFH